MARDAIWQLPGTTQGEDVRLKKSAKGRLARIVAGATEAMVKVTGRSRSGAAHLQAHFDYITRSGTLAAETQAGERITDRARLRELHEDWLLANAADRRGAPRANATQSVALVLSMPPGTPPDRVEAAARCWARTTLGGKQDWLMVRHDDTDHPHVHITVRAVGYDGMCLAPGPPQLHAWREGFARELRGLGVEAEATPRQARGVVRKSFTGPVRGMEQRGVVPRVRRALRQAVERDAQAQTLPPPRDWSRALQLRQEAIRQAYLAHAGTLDTGERADRQLAQAIRRFVAAMPVPLTRRQAMTVARRQTQEQREARPVPVSAPPAAEGQRSPSLPAQAPPRLGPPMPRRRR